MYATVAQRQLWQQPRKLLIDAFVSKKNMYNIIQESKWEKIRLTYIWWVDHPEQAEPIHWSNDKRKATNCEAAPYRRIAWRAVSSRSTLRERERVNEGPWRLSYMSIVYIQYIYMKNMKSEYTTNHMSWTMRASIQLNVIVDLCLGMSPNYKAFCTDCTVSILVTHCTELYPD